MKNITLKQGEPEPAWTEPYVSGLLREARHDVYHFGVPDGFASPLCGVGGSRFYTFSIFNDTKDVTLCAKCKREAERRAQVAA